jgi:hypothetical protein
MSVLRTWLATLPETRCVPIFATGRDLVVETVVRGSGKRLLRRSPEMERTIIDMVAEGLKRPEWRGLLYVLAWGGKERLRPVYIGKAGRFGKKKGVLSANLVNLAKDKGKFARWGDGNAYHIGDLSQTLFGWKAYKDAGQKYERWAEVLFAERSPPRLREPASLLLIPWREHQLGPNGTPCTLEEAEAQAIDLAIEEFEDVVLNVQGETWWAPAAAPARTQECVPRRPFDLVATADALVHAAAHLAAETVVGLDVETTVYSQELRLVQISTRTRTLIVDPLAVPSLEPLRRVLEVKGPTKVIHNAPFERRILGEAGFDVAEVVDTLRLSRQIGPARVSHRLAAVCERYLDRVLDKTAQTSNWSTRPLSPAQLAYAATDAEVLLDLHDALQGRDRTLPLFQT